jgi:hypothetical protein
MIKTFKYKINKGKRLQILNENLWLNRIVEGAEHIRKTWEEYVNVFRLPGDP